MKRFCFSVAVVLMMLCAFSANVSAYSDERTESIADSAGADELSGEFLTKDELSGDKSINVFEKTLKIISSALTDNSRTLFRSFGAVMAVVLLSCAMGAMKFGGNEALDTACGYISLLVLSGVTYSVFYDLFVFVVASMESLSLGMTSLLPIMGSLYAFGGNGAAGAASSSALVLFLTALSAICTKVIFPLLRISFALCLSGAMPGSVNISSVTNLVKNTASTLMAFVFTLLGFTLYIQTSVAAAGDTFFSRSVKFATGVFVPVIGNMLGDASRTVLASVSVIKGTVGISGVVIILAAVIPPLITVVLYKLMLLVCAIAAKALGCERESGFLYDLGSILGVLLALVAGAGAVSIIAMAVFIKTGASV